MGALFKVKSKPRQNFHSVDMFKCQQLRFRINEQLNEQDIQLTNLGNKWTLNLSSEPVI
jgi:hypothetical protein